MAGAGPARPREDMAAREAGIREQIELPRALLERERVEEALRGDPAAGQRPRVRTLAPLAAVVALIAIAVVAGLVAGS